MARTKNVKKEQTTEKRRIDKILCELFQGKDAAIEKYAKVRHTKYEIDLWRVYGLPIRDVSAEAKKYFSVRFLNGKKISEASQAEIDEGVKRLSHAVNDGCRQRCVKLVVELNAALSDLKLDMVSNPESFLDWLTFDYTTPLDEWGRPVREHPHSFEVRIFHDKENRKEFWDELLPMLKKGRVLSMTDVFRFVREKGKRSV